jgi:peroxiredoxin
MNIAVLAVLLALQSPATVGQEAAQTPRQRYDALLKEYGAAVDAWSKIYDQADQKPDPIKRHLNWPAWSFAPRFFKLAEDHPDDPAGVDALLWVVSLDQSVGENDLALFPYYSRALDIFARHHLDEKRLPSLCLQNVSHDLSVPAEGFLRTVLARAPTRDARGNACVGLAMYLATKRRVALDPWFEAPDPNAFTTYNISRFDPSFVPYIRSADPASLFDEASRLFERAIAEFPDLKSQGSGRSLAEIARSELHELRDLSVGSVAPDITGTDADGKSFKINDYRGKVVVLTFSGNWCGPCRAMYPDERDLVKRLKDQPFALVSVNTDGERSTLQKSIKDGEITWRCWWDGSDGPICKQWNVRSYPTVYVLDRAGVIRFTSRRGTSLDQAVMTLLGESPRPKP